MGKKSIIFITFITAGIVFLNGTPAIANKIYEWTDKNGVKNYSQIPPEVDQPLIVQQEELKNPSPENKPVNKPSTEYLKSKKQMEMDALREKKEKDKSDREFEDRKKSEARLVLQKIDIDKEYSEALSECSDKYWPDIRDIEKCRKKIHKKYKKKLEDIENEIIRLYTH